MLAAVLVPLGLWLGHGGVERALLVGSVLLVLIVELLNSAVEATVDRVSLDDHSLAKARQGHRQRGGDALAGQRRRRLAAGPAVNGLQAPSPDDVADRRHYPYCLPGTRSAAISSSPSPQREVR
jgi:hypothetical protein